MRGCLGSKAHTGLSRRRYWVLLLAACLGVTLSGCTDVPPSSGDYVDAVSIRLGDTIAVDGPGAIVHGRTVNIVASGTYDISGTLNDGQILVNVRDRNPVRLILRGAHITNSTSAPIYGLKVTSMILVLADGTENSVADGATYVVADSVTDEPNAAIFSKGDLTIEGNGSLTVDARFDNGIASKDALQITSGHIVVNSVSDGIRGRDSVVVKDGTITVNAESDGVQSDNDEDPTRGFVSIEGGTVVITAAEDGIQAESEVRISGGDTTISSGGGSLNNSAGAAVGDGDRSSGPPTNASPGNSKGIKSAADVTNEGGTIRVDSADDAIHSDNRLTINGGNIVLAARDDGIHADSTLGINGGDLIITRCYEGIESAVTTINGGNIHLTAGDDGLNTTGGGGSYLSINGGYIVIDSATDGLDANGAIIMTGGTVIVNGPIGNDNGAIDYDSGFKITGGTLVGVSGSGMAQAPDATSTQYAVRQRFSTVQPAGTMVRIETGEGEEILTFAPTKAYQSIVFSAPVLRRGATYNFFSGGSSTGAAIDGLFSGGEYSGGMQAGSITIESIVTTH